MLYIYIYIYIYIYLYSQRSYRIYTIVNIIHHTIVNVIRFEHSPTANPFLWLPVANNGDADRINPG